MSEFVRELDIDSVDYTGHLISVVEDGQDGNFILCCFIVDWLAKDRSRTVDLICLSHTKAHYVHTCRKLGMNISDRTKFHQVSRSVALGSPLDLTLPKSPTTLLVIDSVPSLVESGICSDSASVNGYLHHAVSGQTSIVLSSRLNSFLLHRLSSVVLTVSAVPSGPSKDLTGVLEVKKKSPEYVEGYSATKYHFRLTERNVKIFPPGNV